MMNKLKAVAAAAAVCAFVPMSAHAVSFAAGSEMSFYFNSTITGIQGLTFGTSGGAQLLLGDDGTTVIGATATGSALDVTAAGALNTWAGVASQGITISGTDTTTNTTTTLTLNNFAYATSTKQLTFNISVNGGTSQTGAFQVYSCSGLFCTPGVQTTITPFDASATPPEGLFTATKMRLTTASATTIANSLGLSGYAGLLTSVDFGDMAIQAVAVPEPSTYALMGLGLAAAGFVARRRSVR